LEAPSLPKPKLGLIPPAYITETSINLSETNNKLRVIENQLKKNNAISFKELNDFIVLFSNNLWEFEQQSTSNDLQVYGEQLFNALKSYKPLREDYLKFIEILSSHEIENTEELLIGFFENAPAYNRPKNDTGSWNRASFDIFKIIFHELFIYTIAICLKNKNYEITSGLLNSKYYIKDKYRAKTDLESFVFLYNFHENLENYTSMVFNKITGFGDYIITNLSESLKKEDIILADTLCYFISYLDSEIVYKKWFPNTYLYWEGLSIQFFERMSSEKHFEKVKILFNVKTKEELQEILNFLKNNTSKDKIRYGRGSFDSIPFIYELINPDTIGLYR